MPSVQNSDNGEVEKSEVDAEVEQIVDNLVDTGKSWLSRMSNDVSKSSVAKQVHLRLSRSTISIQGFSWGLSVGNAYFFSQSKTSVNVL